MNTTTPIAARITNRLTMLDADAANRAHNATVAAHEVGKGWTTPGHCAFFEAALRELNFAPRILVCGVYRGMDLRLIEYAGSIAGRDPCLTGVDLFSDGPCQDWTDDQRGKSWEENGFGPPPSMEEAAKAAPRARLIKSNSIEFLRSTKEMFDWIYLDTSHDRATVLAEIEAAKPRVNAGGILSGDDYMGPQTWGVAEAVQTLLPHHVVLFNRVWLAA